MALDIDADGGFAARHLGPTPDEVEEMLDVVGCETLQELVDSTVPADIRFERELRLPTGTPEHLLLEELRRRAARNRVFRSYLGMGYHGTITPGVIRRNILENPGWYTQYTPYQAEISQGRLEALLNFQTMVVDLTGLEIANASLLDEGTAAAEAMTLFYGEAREDERNRFFVSRGCHPQTLEILRTRAEPVGIEIVVGDHRELVFDETVFGGLVQYPTTDGTIHDYRDFCEAAHEAGALVAVAADPLALTLLTPPGEFGADAAVGSTQRFGVPMGHGGPHAAYFAIRERFKRKVPGRIIGLSVDADGNRALRMALQTREQHIRREKATSNICTSQVLLAVIAGMYAVYHGPDGLREIARRVRDRTTVLAEGLKRLGHDVLTASWFDTLRIRPVGEGTRDGAMTVLARALESGINLRDFGDGTVGITLDETVVPDDLDDLFRVFSTAAGAVVGAGSGVGESEGGPGEGSPGTPSAPDVIAAELAKELSSPPLPEGVRRTSEYLQHPVFTTHHSETGMLRYIHRLETRDLSLNTSMIPLGSCTMKLNATTEMEAITWSAFSDLHPFAPADQVEGMRSIHEELEEWLAEITGLPAVSLQPNSGAQGEYTGLLVIRAAHRDRGEAQRDVCLIPSSAHGTNPASAVMAGMEVVVVESGNDGTIDLGDLEKKASEHADRLAAIMITYPSTHGVFDPHVRQVCRVVHDHGGLVYLDGANLNAQVGLARPGDYGADVCHINLHKTFAIPHGGGGPGMGPICATDDLRPYLPAHPVVPGVGGEKAIGPVSAAPWGSSLILTISWAYIALLGREGTTRASEIAILNANYMADRLDEHFDILYRGEESRVAHEFILDLRPFRRSADVTEEDVAKRLMDYGFHAPTMSWPVPGTIMVEPTESESKAELDRYCNALISIRAEIEEVASGAADREDNVLRNAPHTASMLLDESWEHPYQRREAAYPASWSLEHKFWPTVRRVDSAYGDRNLVCACPPVEVYRARGVAGDAPATATD